MFLGVFFLLPFAFKGIYQQWYFLNILKALIFIYAMLLAILTDIAHSWSPLIVITWDVRVDLIDLLEDRNNDRELSANSFLGS